MNISQELRYKLRTTRMQNWILVMVLMLLYTQITWAYESKWNRVKPLATEMLSGKIASRLEKEDEILDILYAQEEGYPIIYVDQNAKGSNNGTSWQDAYVSLQQGIDKAAQDEGWVWVAQGTYTGSYVEGGKVVGAIKVKSGAMVFGGFKGGETKLNQRNINKNVTEIHGKAGPYGPRAVDMDHLTLFDGFLVQDSGYKNYPATDAHDIAGGGIRTHGWLAVIRNNRVTNCYAKGGGGVAVWMDEQNPGEKNYAPIIDNNVIYRNIGKCGAGVQLRNDETMFTHNVVAYNHHDERAKGIEVIINKELSDPCNIVDNIVWRNSTAYWGSSVGMSFHDLYNHVRSNDIAHCYYNDFSDINRSEHWDGLMVQNPLFVDPENNDFTLQEDSPCLNAGHPDGPKDIDGTRANMGLRKELYQVTINNNGVAGQHTESGYFGHDEQLTLTVESPVVINDTTRYIFNHWEGEGSGSYTGDSLTVTISPLGDISQTIIWDKQYRLQAKTNTSTDSKSGWYNVGETVTLTVPQVWNESDSIRNRFLSWQPEGNAQTQISNTNINIHMTGPLYVNVDWQKEYRVQVSSQFQSTHGSDWYPSGSSATIKADSIIQDNGSHRYVFDHWNYHGSLVMPLESNSIVVLITEPITMQALYSQQYLLTLQSPYGTTFGQGWHQANATVDLGVDSLAAIDAGTRQRFLYWTRSGDTEYQDTLAHPSIIMSEALTQTAHWQQEFYLTIKIEPQNTGQVTPLSAPGDWIESNKYVQLTAAGNAVAGYGFKQWKGDVSGDRNLISFRMTSAKTAIAEFALGDYTITSIPSGLKIEADGVEFTTPQIFYWQPGQTHQISAQEIQDGSGGIRYHYNRWQHIASRENTILLSSGVKTYTVLFDTSYQVIIDSDFGTPEGAGWYPSGATISLNVDSLVNSDTTGIRNRFISWNVIGSTTTYPQTELQLWVNEPKTAQINWNREYLLDKQAVPYYSGTFQCTPEGPWYSPGTTVTVQTQPVDTNFTFVNWQGDLSGNTTTQTVTMDQSKQICANYSTATIFPPQIRMASQYTILEDSTLCFSREKIQELIIDANDPFDSLHFSITTTSPILLKNTTQYPIELYPESNWNGEANIVLHATDPYGLTSSDTLMLRVLPVSDAPMPFVLLSPEEGSIQYEADAHLKFTWSQSYNVDEGDTITYMFNISPDSTFSNSQTITVVALTDTFVTINSDLIAGKVFWGVNATDKQGMTTWCSKKFKIDIQTDVALAADGVPKTFSLYQNYPNPFNGFTQIEYEVPQPGQIHIDIFDIKGQYVTQLLDQKQNAGHYQVQWQGTDQHGNHVASGIYFVQIQFNRQRLIRKMSYVR